MSLFTQRTQLDIDLAFKDSLILRALEAANHAAITLKECFDLFYALPPDRLADVLNNSIPSTLAMFAGNTSLGQAANNALDAASFGTVRAPVELPPSVTFDGKKFTVSTTQEPCLISQENPVGEDSSPSSPASASSSVPS